MQKNLKDVKDVKLERSTYNIILLYVYIRSLLHDNDADDAINV